MRNTRKSGQILRSKKRPRPTLRSGRGSRTNSNTSHQIPARVIRADKVNVHPVCDVLLVASQSHSLRSKPCEKIMSFFERLKTEASADYTEHPFTNGLADGSLAEAPFRRYLVQDYLFLHVKPCAGWGLSPSAFEQTPPAVEMLAYTRYRSTRECAARALSRGTNAISRPRCGRYQGKSGRSADIAFLLLSTTSSVTG